MRILASQTDDAAAFGKHLERLINHVNDTQIIRFTPRKPGSFKFEKSEQFFAEWDRSLDEGPWQRCWFLKTDKDEIIGHINLRSPAFDTAIHRAELGIGIEGPYQNNGYGKKLMNVALEFVKNHKQIEIVTLRVFSNNLRAIDLYKKYDFEVSGVIKKAFKIEGQEFDDITMVRYF